jgi:hypothetical protein
MINSEKLKHVLNAYRKDFHKKDENKNNKSHWDCEKYKWVAVNHFQKNWNIDADNFVEMFKEATVKCYNLLDSQNYFPRKSESALTDTKTKNRSVATARSLRWKNTCPHNNNKFSVGSI